MRKFIPVPSSDAYESRLASEKGIYNQRLEVHDLPPIFHYWSNRYIRPILGALGFESLNDLFKNFLEEQCVRSPTSQQRFISIGSGNCDLEIEIASHLLSRNHRNFVLECLDVNSLMLERGRGAAQHAGVLHNLDFVIGDFNRWNPEGEYDAVIANQSLHHVLNLEHLFEQIEKSLKPTGSFILSDMIGRNGHQRWPEALDIVHEFWRDLPPSYRFNESLNRYEELYRDWDCSVEGFEGVRSQDILPLLLLHFHFKLFLPFANVIDPFVDRAFGFHFDAAADWDRAFIDRVHERDRAELTSGRLTPTHLLAVLGNRPTSSLIMQEPFSPAFCVRSSDRVDMRLGSSLDTRGLYRWKSWPQSPETEAEIACRRLQLAGDQVVELERDLKTRTAWARKLERDFEDRTAWARRVEAELKERTDSALLLDKESVFLRARLPELEQVIVERTAWARCLEKELNDRTAWAKKLVAENEVQALHTQNLERELRERTEWALRLEAQLAERTAWALQLRLEAEKETSRALTLERELFAYIHNPFRYLTRLLAGIRNRSNRSRKSNRSRLPM